MEKDRYCHFYCCDFIAYYYGPVHISFSGLMSHQRDTNTLEIGVKYSLRYFLSQGLRPSLTWKKNFFLLGTKVTHHTCFLTLCIDHSSDKPLFGDYNKVSCALARTEQTNKNAERITKQSQLIDFSSYFSPKTVPMLKCNKIYIKTSCQASDTVDAWR